MQNVCNMETVNVYCTLLCMYNDVLTVAYPVALCKFSTNMYVLQMYHLKTSLIYVIVELLYVLFYFWVIRNESSNVTSRNWDLNNLYLEQIYADLKIMFKQQKQKS